MNDTLAGLLQVLTLVVLLAAAYVPLGDYMARVFTAEKHWRVETLVYTNAPGSRHPKRWQDVEDLLDAGVDVISTVNVQHLESLNDVVERITGVRQRETVPDEVVRRAEQMELVDITPEALRRRFAHGNVYAAEKVDAALANYFQPGNLTALRELALLWVADEVDVAVQRYRSEKNVQEVWETRERVVVALTGDKESETVLRRAARIAKRSGAADLLAVHVLRGDGLVGAPAAAIPKLRAWPRTSAPASTPWSAARTCPPRCSTSPAAPTPPSSCSAPRAVPGSRGCSSRASAPGSRPTPAPSTCTWSPTTRRAAGSGCPRCAGRSRRCARCWAGRWPSCCRSWRPVWVAWSRCPRTSSGVGGRPRSGVPGGRAGRAAAQLLPHPAAVLVHDRRARERRHAGRDGRCRGIGGAGGRSGGPANAAGRAGPRRGRAARVVRPHGAHPHRPAPAAPGEGARVVRAVLGGAPRVQRAAAQAEESRRHAEATETRSALLSAVGHDLRSPLTSIKVAAASVRDPNLHLPPSDRLELTASIEESADRLTALVDNLLDSSRLAAGAVTPLLAPVGFDEVAVRALVGLDGAARVTLDIDETLPDVLADAGLLERVVANVVDNALRYAGDASIVLRASAYHERVELRIVDAGPGVPRRERESLFVPFWRLGADPSDRDGRADVGLGLAVARGFTEVMGGRLTAEDTPGGGLTVVVALPAAEVRV